MKNKKKPSCFILDVDGVMTTGQFIYSQKGKNFKVFGPDDNDGLSLLRPYVDIRFVTGDKTGYKITKKRIVDDMSYPLDLVSTIRRIDWIKKNFKLNQVIYMGDGIFDHLVMKNANYAVTLKNSLEHVLNSADYVTKRNSGDRAVAETVIHILKVFFNINFANIKKFKIKLN